MTKEQAGRPTGADWLPPEGRGGPPGPHGAIERASYADVDAWRAGISQAFVPLSPEATGAAPFHGAFQKITRGAIGLARIEGSAQRVRRGARDIAETRGDFAYFNIQLSGFGQVRGGGGVRRTNPGQAAIVLAENPFELEFDTPFSQLCVTMPVDWLRERLELPLALLVTRNVDLVSGPERVVGAALRALIDAADAAEAAQCADLFALALDHTLRPHQAHVPPAERSLMAALGRLLRHRLADETLCPVSAAAALGCSVRTLHAACQREGRSFGRMVLDARLDAAERALRATPMTAGRVGPIAFACGFSDRAHFSRVFRARFGTSPRAYPPS
ncbi:AraC family transcriptional regulator [Sphingomonas hylomeconis]|uniref:AraC family transcriptional regulator n=1 Tax=Sphingomonas hylomeconis TaxID=1395958 RepID=A0ABV7STE2_9SPHN|nr:AraC family transcriptional regulator [Sphingomonas hylomeconis]